MDFIDKATIVYFVVHQPALYLLSLLSHIPFRCLATYTVRLMSFYILPRFFPSLASAFPSYRDYDAIIFPSQKRTRYGVNGFHPVTPDPCLTGTRARLVGSDGRCQIPPSLPYPAEQGLQGFPSAALYSHFMTVTASRSVKYSQLVPTAPSIMTSTNSARREMSCCFQIHE